MNVVLVVFDSLRKDCVGYYGNPPWWPVQTPNLDRFAAESLAMTRAYPESLPTLPARRALYTARRVYPFWDADFLLKGDFHGAPGWGPIPEAQDTISEVLQKAGYRTGLISDCYHMFKASKNFSRGFDQWVFLRGQEIDPARTGPPISQAELDHWLPPELQKGDRIGLSRLDFLRRCLLNMHERTREEDYFCPRVMIEASRWLEQNRDADNFFLVVESFDPHEPWFVPEWYRRPYDGGDGPEQVISFYEEVGHLSPALVKRTRANYSGLVTMCDRWFGHLYETMRALGMLENTVVIVTADHGHSIGDGNYMGKRGYPSSPEVYDLPLLIRHPQGIGAGQRSDMLVQHIDIGASLLEMAGVPAPGPLDGQPFWERAVRGGQPIRDHVTVGWGSAVTVISERWWLNSKVNGKGAFLYDLRSPDAFATNLAGQYPDVAKDLFQKGVADAGSPFPDYILEMAEQQADAPGCSALAARE
ncbi:MAG: sulfatase [Bacteroidetes bacterium]|nr:sulfatase [Bacteroidota bacterium]MCL5025667.1 sulfatase [Chloroflexota bacterium]